MLLLDKNNLVEYLRAKYPQWIPKGNLRVSRIGESEEDAAGLINYLFRVMGEDRSLIVKQGREDILGLVAKLHREQGMTVILVSHSMEDVARYVSRLVVMNHGEKVFDGTPKEVFRHYKELEAIGLAAPQITYVVHALKEQGVPIDEDITTVEEARDAILAIWKKQGAAQPKEETC